MKLTKRPLPVEAVKFLGMRDDPLGKFPVFELDDSGMPTWLTDAMERAPSTHGSVTWNDLGLRINMASATVFVHPEQWLVWDETAKVLYPIIEETLYLFHERKVEVGGFKYRKKPVLVEAFQMTRARREASEDWPAWLQLAWRKMRGQEGSLYPSCYPSNGKDELNIMTLEGEHRVSFDDYIIQGVKGELYPCKPDIFEATYTQE